MAEFTFQFDMPPLPFNRPARDGQAETNSSAGTRSRLVDAIKPLKDFLPVFRSDSWTLIGDFDHDVSGRSSDPQTDRQPFAAITNRVVYDVQQSES